MGLTCPCCVSFETNATPNTRCRVCRVVVRIGTGHPREPNPQLLVLDLDCELVSASFDENGRTTAVAD